MSSSNKNIALVCGYPIPEGMAATNRIMTYSKGMVENRANVDIYSYIPSGENDVSILDNEGWFNGVHYHYPFRRKRFKSKMLHVLEIIYSVFRTYRKIKSESVKKKYDAVIISSDRLSILFCFSNLSHRIGSKSIFIFDEYPIPIRKYLEEKIPFIKILLYKLILKRISGYIAMTHNLAKFYCEIMPKPSLVISSITDLERFNFVLSEPSSPRNICYMGNMELAKDNVDNIIRAFAFIATEFDDVDLYLYGRPSPQDKSILEKLINNLGLKQRVFFDFAKYEEVPAILSLSYILLSSQPDTKRAQGGFPTKLGEYLATGVPVLLTNVGEISSYVTDMENVFLVEPENPESYAVSLKFILNNYSMAKKIGLAGRKLVIDNYSHIAAGERIIDFIKSLD